MDQPVRQDNAEAWRYHHIRVPVLACRIATSDLQKLFDIINEKQLEVANTIDPLLAKLPAETEEQFESRRSRLRNAYVTLVSISAPGGATLHGSSRDIFTSPLMPERIQSVLFNTSNALKAVGITPPNEATLFLDFGKPPAINIGVGPSAPTPNDSNFEIQGRTEAWVTALDARLRQFFELRKAGLGWVHRQGSYEILLLLIGLPIAIWSCLRISPLFISARTPSMLASAVYVYVFFFGLYLFRLLFDYTRWVFPLVELEGERAGPSSNHRRIWWFLLSGVALAAIYDAIKHFLFAS